MPSYWDLIRDWLGHSPHASILWAPSLSGLATVRNDEPSVPMSGTFVYHLTLFFTFSYSSSSADSLDEIVGLDISYHGANASFPYNSADDSSSLDQHVAEHRQRRQQQREANQKRGTLRRRILLLDLSKSDHETRQHRQQAGGQNNIVGIEEGPNEVF